MVIRFTFISLFSLMIYNVSAHPILVKRLVTPQDASLSFIFEVHDAQQKTTKDTDQVLAILKSAEQQGNPYHVLIEQKKKIINTEERNLLIDLVDRAEKELKDTVFENIENRKISAIAETLLDKALFLQLMTEIANDSSQIHTEIPANTGKTWDQLTLHDVLKELENLFAMASDVMKRYEQEKYIYDRLAIHMHNALEKMNVLTKLIENKHVDTKQPLYLLSKVTAAEMHAHIQGPRDDLFDFNALDRILKLLGVSKKNLLVIAGREHNRVLTEILAKKYIEVTNQHINTLEDLNVLTLSLQSFLEKRKGHKKTTSTEYAFSLACETLSKTAQLISSWI